MVKDEIGCQREKDKRERKKGIKKKKKSHKRAEHMNEKRETEGTARRAACAHEKNGICTLREF